MNVKYPLQLVLIILACLSINRVTAQNSVAGLATGKTPVPPARAVKPVVIGYVGGFRGLINTDVIEANKLTHINYAFVDVQHNRAFLTNEKTDTVNFKKLNVLKQVNPDLKILISIGGWAWSENFSDAVLTDTARKAFAASAVDIVKKWGLDGVDIDWEYPALPGEEGNVYRFEDRENFTLLFQELKTELDALERSNGRKMYLTLAAGAGASFFRSSFVKHTEMDKVQQYVDYVNLMTYDFSGDSVARHHTNLYPSGFINENSVERSVNEFVAAGVPARKIVVGAGFYAHVYNLASSEGSGLGQKTLSRVRMKNGYTFIKDSLENQNGYKKYWDKRAMAPYLFNSKNRMFFSYDDEESIKRKCEYIKKRNLAGIMFWEYLSDPKNYLLNAINDVFK